MLQLPGVEVYFHDVEDARRFYRDLLGLKILDAQGGHDTRFNRGSAVVHVERERSESCRGKTR